MARCRDVATRGGESATYRHRLRACHPNGVPVLLKEDAATVAELLRMPARKPLVDCGDMCRYVCESSSMSSSVDDILEQDDVHQQIRLLRHADVEDFNVGCPHS